MQQFQAYQAQLQAQQAQVQAQQPQVIQPVSGRDMRMEKQKAIAQQRAVSDDEDDVDFDDSASVASTGSAYDLNTTTKTPFAQYVGYGIMVRLTDGTMAQDPAGIFGGVFAPGEANPSAKQKANSRLRRLLSTGTPYQNAHSDMDWTKRQAVRFSIRSPIFKEDIQTQAYTSKSSKPQRFSTADFH